MFIGIKIKNLVKARGLMIKTLTEKWGIEPHHFSRMLREKLVFNDKKVAIASEFLGVSEDYLRDESRPFNKGDRIPQDVLIERAAPTIPTATPADIRDVARMMERQAADIERSKNDLLRHELEAIKEAQREILSVLQEISGNSLATSANLLAVTEIVKELQEEKDGEHDPD